MIMIDTKDFPALEGQQAGRELDLELTVVVTKVELMPHEGGSPSELVTLALIRGDITQTS